MQAHPIMDSSRRWISFLLLVAEAIGIYTGLLMTYAGAWLWPALTEGTVYVVVFCGYRSFQGFIRHFVLDSDNDVV